MITPAQCRAARGLVDLSQQQLADAAKVGVVTVRQFEAGAAQPRNATAEVIQRALEAAGVEFTNGGRPGVRMKRVDAKCAKCGYGGTVETGLTTHSGVPARCPAGYSPMACPEFRKAVSAAHAALRAPNPKRAAEFAAKAMGDQRPV
jgi:transcriptional regulator with XRE-family HTH domain